MVTRGRVRFKAIIKMLKACAPGFVLAHKPHNSRVTWNGRTFPRLPRGKHGKRENPEIEVGHVRHMVNQLEIDLECAKAHLPPL